MNIVNKFLYLQDQGLVNIWQYFPFLLTIMFIMFCYFPYITDKTENKRTKVFLSLLLIISIGSLIGVAVNAMNTEISHIEKRQETVIQINEKINDGYKVYIQSDITIDNMNQLPDYKCKYEYTQKYRHIVNEDNKTVSIIFK